jgi:type I restriction enzyme, R subunit
MSAFSPSESEWLTRRTLINPKLKAAGWRVVPFEDHKPLDSYARCAIEEYQTENGPADYALCVVGQYGK